MRRLIQLLFLSSLLTHLPAFSNTVTLSVPFPSYQMAVNQTIQASYTIGMHKEIFCFALNTQTVGNISWPYKGTTPQSTLPVLLKSNSQYEGQFADDSGTITIHNNTGQQLAVGCQFGF